MPTPLSQERMVEISNLYEAWKQDMLRDQDALMECELGVDEMMEWPPEQQKEAAKEIGVTHEELVQWFQQSTEEVRELMGLDMNNETIADDE